MSANQHQSANTQHIITRPSTYHPLHIRLFDTVQQTIVTDGWMWTCAMCCVAMSYLYRFQG